MSMRLLTVVMLTNTIIDHANNAPLSLLAVNYCGMYNYIRVESWLDDPDNLGHLGHFFGGSSGSHLQTNLSGCDPDITCSLENSVGIW